MPWTKILFSFAFWVFLHIFEAFLFEERNACIWSCASSIAHSSSDSLTNNQQQRCFKTSVTQEVENGMCNWWFFSPVSVISEKQFCEAAFLESRVGHQVKVLSVEQTGLQLNLDGRSRGSFSLLGSHLIGAIFVSGIEFLHIARRALHTQKVQET